MISSYPGIVLEKPFKTVIESFPSNCGLRGNRGRWTINRMHTCRGPSGRPKVSAEEHCLPPLYNQRRANRRSSSVQSWCDLSKDFLPRSTMHCVGIGCSMSSDRYRLTRHLGRSKASPFVRSPHPQRPPMGIQQPRELTSQNFGPCHKRPFKVCGDVIDGRHPACFEPRSVPRGRCPLYRRAQQSRG
jgi:hypothetical protein